MWLLVVQRSNHKRVVPELLTFLCLAMEVGVSNANASFPTLSCTRSLRSEQVATRSAAFGWIAESKCVVNRERSELTAEGER